MYVTGINIILFLQNFKTLLILLQQIKWKYCIQVFFDVSPSKYIGKCNSYKGCHNVWKLTHKKSMLGPPLDDGDGGDGGGGVHGIARQWAMLIALELYCLRVGSVCGRFGEETMEWQTAKSQLCKVIIDQSWKMSSGRCGTHIVGTLRLSELIMVDLCDNAAVRTEWYWISDPGWHVYNVYWHEC